MARLIADVPDKMRRIPLQLDAKGRQKRCLNRPSKEPKPKSFYAHYPGHWFALDTIVRCHDGMRGYILTAMDLDSRIAVAVATNSHTSRTAAACLNLTLTIFPAPVQYILTDGGCEFQDEFAAMIQSMSATNHGLTYPKRPQMNAQIKRFNRTVQEDFVDYHAATLFADMAQFNDRLWSYLVV